MLDRWIVESINHTITISIRSDRRRLVACGRLSFDRIGNSIVVAVQIQIVSNAIAVRIDWCGRTELIPDTVAIEIFESSVHRFLVINNTTTVSISINRKLITTFKQIADAIVVAVDVTPVVDPVPIRINTDQDRSKVNLDRRSSSIGKPRDVSRCGGPLEVDVGHSRMCPADRKFDLISVSNYGVNDVATDHAGKRNRRTIVNLDAIVVTCRERTAMYQADFDRNRAGENQPANTVRRIRFILCNN